MSTIRRQLGKFDIISRIGRGGMAEVYKAYQPSLDRLVALKLLHPFLADDPEFKERFEREARNVARLKHANIVQVYDFEYDNDSESYYMVMELIDGKTLKEILEASGNQPMALEDALKIMATALEALVYAHGRNMIHRDLKPANLMIENDGRVVMTDFGIAKIVTGNQFTASGGMAGTPAYMAPEQGLGEPGDERGDIYSMGVMLYQLVTGRLPYDAETPLAVILKHLNDPIPSARGVNPNIPEAVEKIIRKALAKDPGERYQRAEDMLIDIQSYLRSGKLLVANESLARLTERANIVPQRIGSQDTPLLRRSQVAAMTAKAQRRRRLPMVLSTVTLALVLLAGGVALATGRLPIFGLAQNQTATVDVAGTQKFVPTQTPLTVGAQTLPSSATPARTDTVPPTTSPTATLTATLTPTATATATWTVTASATNSPSVTPSATATHTATVTPSLTNTPTSTLTFTPTRTFTPSVTFTPTVDLTGTMTVLKNIEFQQTQSAFNTQVAVLQSSLTPTIDYTATAERCTNQFALVEPIATPGPNSFRDPRLIKVGTPFEYQIRLRNTGDCDWLPPVYLQYESGDQMAIPLRVPMENVEPVAPGEVAEFRLRGEAEAGKPLTWRVGKWRVRLQDGKDLGGVEITIYVYTSGR